MAISIKDEETDRLARAVARAHGETLTEAIRRALEERLARQAGRPGPGLHEEVRRIQQRIGALPVLDPRPADEILGYDDHGLPR